MCDHESIRVLIDTLSAEDLASAIQEHNNVTPDEMAFFVRNGLKAYLESNGPIDIFQFLAYWKWYLLAATEINFDELEAYELCGAILRAFIRVRALSI